MSVDTKTRLDGKVEFESILDWLKTNIDSNAYMNPYKKSYFSNDTANQNIRGSIRSRGPIINTVAARFGGGGHIFASGVRLPDVDAVEKLVESLDEACKEYKEKNTL